MACMRLPQHRRQDTAINTHTQSRVTYRQVVDAVLCSLDARATKLERDTEDPRWARPPGIVQRGALRGSEPGASRCAQVHLALTAPRNHTVIVDTPSWRLPSSQPLRDHAILLAFVCGLGPGSR